MAEQKYDGVRAVSDSSIELDFYYRNRRCRERLKLKPNKSNINYCVNFRARILHEIAKNEFDYRKHFPDSPRWKQFTHAGASVPIKDYLTGWLAREKQVVRASTFTGYQKIFKYHLIPSFGSMTLAELRQSHIQRWVDTKPHMSPKRVRNILSP